MVGGTLLWQALLFVAAIEVSTNHLLSTHTRHQTLLATGLVLGGEVLNLVALARLIRHPKPSVVNGAWTGVAVLALLLGLLLYLINALRDYAQALRD
ncbi:hypothetical protein DLM85_18290 [Hymenobacter edaphi]|uniref:Uncharacterized protein n=1 Tax=Hymenobacter edaphi TaxID=2211146 RepID=A0A328BCB4_9BACT|nr:hypothetical protein DLM85_18290 [Hymenobacter edaphi]